MNNQKRRLAIIERSRKYRTLLFLIISFWTLIGLVIWKVDPDNLKDLHYLPMALLLFGGLFSLLTLLFLSSRHAFLWTIGILFYTYLRVWKIGNLWTAFSLLGLLLTIEVYQIVRK